MGGLSSDQSDLYLSHGLVSRFQHKLHILSRQKIRSRILQFRVGSDTCWFSEHVSLREHACVSSRGAQSTELVSLYIGYWTLNNYYYYYY